MTPEESLLRLCAPFVDRSGNGGFVMLLTKDNEAWVYNAVLSAEGAMRVAQKTLEVIRNLALANKDLITVGILNATLKTFQTKVAETMLRMGADAAAKN